MASPFDGRHADVNSTTTNNTSFDSNVPSSSSSSSSILLLDPMDFVRNDKIFQMPKSLSPSAIMEFQQCPQSFLFQYIFKLRQPPSLATVKGTMCHAALEQVFDLEPSERTLSTLQDLFRVAWSQHRLQDKYATLFSTNTTTTQDTEAAVNVEQQQQDNRDLQAEREWGQSALQLLQNYYELEDPKLITRPNPLKREVWLHTHLPIDPEYGVTAAAAAAYQSHPNNNNNGEEGEEEEAIPNYTTNSIMTSDNTATASRSEPASETFYMRGIVDRLDMVRVPYASKYHRNHHPPSSSSHNSQHHFYQKHFPTQTQPESSNNSNHNNNAGGRGRGAGVALKIVDYKTGKAPNLKYSKAMNEQIVEKSFYQLKVYALLMRENSVRQSSPIGTGPLFPPDKSGMAAGASTTTNTVTNALSNSNGSLDIRYLELLYLNSESGQATPWLYDLGETQMERDAVLYQVHQDLSQVYQTIQDLIARQDPKAFVGCARTFCYCHQCRPRFLPGTLWEPTENTNIDDDE